MPRYEFGGMFYCEYCKPSDVDTTHHRDDEPDDQPLHCMKCKTFLKNPITEDGRASLLTAVASAVRGHTSYRRGDLLTWVEFYGIGAKDLLLWSLPVDRPVLRRRGRGRHSARFLQ